ncbi:membrane protein [Sphingobacterium sp. ML3W]|uniref:efflux transporter outer membrane subunit n=1 Tax=Sphingobacterium sp. ML3W TaxID=1538644 RepID=UPI0004F783EE|nr:TolC family protein [Sphingobacterium sp. ML3W]AIM38355.1 membrane protein [Sphingobacterium sp. ML3W]
MKNSIIISISVLFLVSCGVTKRDYKVQNNIVIAESFINDELTNEVFLKNKITKNWWSEFNDHALDTLIKKARNHNLDIKSSVANLQAARAFLKESKLDRLPTITATADYTRTRLGENIFVPGSNPAYSTYNTGFDVFWEADVFGRVSHKIMGANSNSKLAMADMQDIYISIFAEVANNYMEFRGMQHLLDIAERNLKGQKKTYDLTVKLSEAGTSNNLDVVRALAQLEITRASIPPFEARIEALKNSLSVLIGEVPGNLDSSITNKQPLPSLPTSVSLGDIEEMLRRRPAVRRAEATLQGRIAKYNVSVAELYPKIEFGGSIGFSAIDFANFGNKESFTWSLLPRISWAAFNLGRVKQQIKRDDALTLAALYQYEKVVLGSLEEIKTSLSNYTQGLKRRDILHKSSQASAEAVNFARQRYNAGLDSFIDYLTADNALLISENSLALSEIQLATSLIAIYKALGGGWEIVSEKEIIN